MNIPMADLVRLRGSALVFIILCAMGAGIVAAARSNAVAEEAGNRTAHAQQADVRAQLERIDADAHAIRAYRDRFHVLQMRGVVGAEQRQEWIKRIAASGRAHAVGNVRYELAPRRAAPPSVGGSEFMISRMKLQMQLLHEEALLGFIADLSDNMPAYLRVRSCDVERLAASTDVAQPRLHANCNIDLVTLQEKT